MSAGWPCPAPIVHVLARPQFGDDVEPLPGVGVAVVVFERRRGPAPPVPGRNQPLTTLIASRPSAMSAMLAASLANTNGLNSSGLIAPISSMRVGGLGQGGERRPRLQDVVLDVARVNDVLRHRGRVVAGALGTQQQVTGAAVARVGSVVRMVAGTVVAVDRRPHPEPRSRSRRRQVTPALPVADLPGVLGHSLRAMAAKSRTDAAPRISRIVSSRVASSSATPERLRQRSALAVEVASFGRRRLAARLEPATTAASAEATNQYGLASEAPVRNSMRVASGVWLDQRPDGRAAVVAAPVHGGGGEGVRGEAPVGVDRVGAEQRDRRQVFEQPGDREQRQFVLAAVVGRERRLAVAPQRNMQVCRASRVLGERLRHEARDLAVLAGDLLGRVLEPGAVVGGLEGVGVDQVGLDLPGAVLGLDALQSGEGTEGFVQVGEHRVECVGVLQRVGVDVVSGTASRRVRAGRTRVRRRPWPCSPAAASRSSTRSQHRPRVEQRRGAVVGDDVGDDVADTGAPRQRLETSRDRERRRRRDSRRPSWSAAVSRSPSRRRSSPARLRRTRSRFPWPGRGTAPPESACPAA